MKLITIKRLNILLVILLLLVLGFYRDYLFKQVNALLKAWDFDMNYEMPSPWGFLENYHYDTVVSIKWVLTLLFSLLFMLVSLLAIRTLFRQRKYLYITAGAYIGLLLTSALIMVIGAIFKGSSENMYALARYLMGMAQSPVILMILIPAFKLSGREQQNIGN